VHIVKAMTILGWERLVEEHGQDPDEVYRQLDLAPGSLDNPDAFVSHDTIARLLELCRELCGQPLFGLLLGQRQGIEVLGELTLLTPRNTTLGRALEATARRLHLQSSAASIRIRDSETTVCLEMIVESNQPHSVQQKTLLGVAQLALYVRWALGDSSFPGTVQLRQPGPDRTEASRVSPQGRVVYGSEFNGLTVSPKLLRQKVRIAPESLGQERERYMGQLRQMHPHQLWQQVARVMGDLLPSGECSLERVADTLNLSPRTLQTHLADEGHTYRDLLKNVREQIARERLVSRDTSLTELALQLGYAELAVFSRHFKQWTGLSPRAWAQQHRQGGDTAPSLLNGKENRSVRSPENAELRSMS